MKKIEKLKEDQIAKFTEYVQKWLKIGLCTKRADRKLAETLCKAAYKSAGLEEPKLILWAESPLGMLMTAKLVKEASKTGIAPYAAASPGAQVEDQVRAQVEDQVGDQVGAQVRAQVGDQVWVQVRAQVGDQVGDQVWNQVRDQVRDQVRVQVSDQVWNQVGDQKNSSLRDEWDEFTNGYSCGQHEAGWLSFYAFMREVLNLTKETEKLQAYSELCKETGWHMFYKNVAVLSEKPTEVHRNEAGQLHNFNGPAVKYADGFGIYYFNNVSLYKKEKYAVPTMPTKEDIISEENVDVRRELVKKLGIEKAIEVLGAEVTDTYESPIGGKYELLMIDYDGRGTKRPYLKMSNPSLKGTYHIEGCSPETKTVKEALCFRNGLKQFIEPVSLS